MSSQRRGDVSSPILFLERNFEQANLKIKYLSIKYLIKYLQNEFACQFVDPLDNLLARYRLM